MESGERDAIASEGRAPLRPWQPPAAARHLVCVEKFPISLLFVFQHHFSKYVTILLNSFSLLR